ncbi:hypothetical protein BP6252_09992 [Coleophoma cylindrospora]|uniref:DUF833-domain-containing protein n=1 Tax=Coleophoma cylindrospora TaxID=1849047 RepID=A0A3D8QX52_9HELO|nr:hypothetical protein BP6252_09992 [Coleophoma cylindrospora]
MCIALITTAHPSYALIILDNRDEFILRPTSLPHWWTSANNNQQVLSSRDLLRPEQGTWLGITKSGNFAVLTNFRETDDPSHPIQGLKSRGGMVTAWLGAEEDVDTATFVRRLFEDGGVKGVGGFSLVAGKLRKDGAGGIEPLAVISNRSGGVEDVPWIAGERDQVHGLSNTSFHDPKVWPKVRMGKDMVSAITEQATKERWDEEKLVNALFQALDTDTLPPAKKDEAFEEYLSQLRESVFIPPIGSENPEEIPKADEIAAAKPIENGHATNGDVKIINAAKEAEKAKNFMSGVYGTQRQTIILVDWDGKVTYRERALYDEHGKPIERGHGDQRFEFKIEGWDGK